MEIWVKLGGKSGGVRRASQAESEGQGVGKQRAGGSKGQGSKQRMETVGVAKERGRN